MSMQSAESAPRSGPSAYQSVFYAECAERAVLLASQPAINDVRRGKRGFRLRVDPLLLVGTVLAMLLICIIGGSVLVAIATSNSCLCAEARVVACDPRSASNTLGTSRIVAEVVRGGRTTIAEVDASVACDPSVVVNRTLVVCGKGAPWHASTDVAYTDVGRATEGTDGNGDTVYRPPRVGDAFYAPLTCTTLLWTGIGTFLFFPAATAALILTVYLIGV